MLSTAMPSEGRKVWNFSGAEANKGREVKSPKRHSPAWCKSRVEGEEGGELRQIGGKGQRKITTAFTTEFQKKSRNSNARHLRAEAVDRAKASPGLLAVPLRSVPL